MDDERRLYTRRGALRLFGGTLAGAALGGGIRSGSAQEATPTATVGIIETEREEEYELDELSDNVYDKQLLESGGDGSILSVQFGLVEESNLQTIICLSDSGVYALMSRELEAGGQPHDKPKILFVSNPPYPYEMDCIERPPVTRMAIGDAEQVLIGAGKTPTDAFTDMRVYQLTHPEGDIVRGMFLGHETIQDWENIQTAMAPMQVAA